MKRLSLMLCIIMILTAVLPLCAVNGVAVTETKIVFSDPSVVFTGTWTEPDTVAKRSNVAGSACELTFSGTGVKLYIGRGAGAGKFDVYIDSVLKQTVDAYKSAPATECLFTSEELTDTSHTIKIVVREDRNPSAKNNNVNVAYFMVSAPDHSVPDGYAWQKASRKDERAVYSGTWTDFGETIRSSAAGEYCEFTFTGKGIELFLGGGAGAGIASIYLDGALVKTHDCYNAAASTKSAYKVTDIDGRHVIRIENSGTKNDQATSTNINVAYFMVLAPVFPEAATVSSADELIAYIALVNSSSSTVTKNTTVTLSADIDMSGKTWVPMNRYLGTFDGNGKTISGITYSTNAAEGNFGLIVNNLTNDTVRGTVKSLTIKDSALTAASTSGAVGAIAGEVDRGRIEGCAIDNVKVTGNAVTGGIAGSAVYKTDADFVYVSGCSVNASEIKGKDYVGGIVGTALSDAPVKLGNVTLTASSISSETLSTGITVAKATQQASADTLVFTGSTCNSKIGVTGDNNYEAYYQTRQGEGETTDFRVIVVGREAWLTTLAEATLTIIFTNAENSESRSTVTKTSVAYEKLNAAADGYTDSYTAAEGVAVFGWTVKGVPDGWNVSSLTLG